MERLLNEPIDAVFTGEAYGDLLAERWGVRARAACPAPRLISGTAGAVPTRPRSGIVADPGRPRVPAAGGW